MIWRIPFFWQKGKAIAFAFSAKKADFKNFNFLAKSKAIGFAFSAKTGDLENSNFLAKVRL